MQANPRFGNFIDTTSIAAGAVLTAAHCFVSTAGQRYTLIAIRISAGAYVYTPDSDLFYLGNEIDCKIPQEYLGRGIGYLKWDIAVLTLPPVDAVPEDIMPADAYPKLGKLLLAQVATKT